MKKALSITIALMIGLLSATDVVARSAATLRWYSDNQIMFYDEEENCVPSGGTNSEGGTSGSNPGGTTSDSTVTILPGSNVAEKVWNWFASAGIAGVSDNPNVIAGIIGNFMTEAGGGFNINPFAENAGGCFGMYQGCGGRSASLRAAFSAAGLSTSGGNVDKAIDVTLTHLVTADDGSFHTFVGALGEVGSNTAEAYSDMFLVIVERAVGGDSPILDPGAKSRSNGGPYQASAARRANAAQALAAFAGNTSQVSETATIIQTNTQSIMNPCPTNGSSGGGSGEYPEAPEAGELTSGGMSLEQAIRWMNAYRTEALKASCYGGSDHGSTTFQGGYISGPCWGTEGVKGGLLSNCSAFSMWFANKYGNAGMTGTVNGNVTASHLMSLGWGNGGKTPQPYAVWSDQNQNHTGVVLGISVEKNQVITGEAAWGGWSSASSPSQYPPGDASSDMWLPRVRVYTLSEFSNTHYVFALNPNPSI